MKAVAVGEIEMAAETMKPVFEQLGLETFNQAFIMGANWALIEMERRKGVSFEVVHFEDHYELDALEG